MAGKTMQMHSLASGFAKCRKNENSQLNLHYTATQIGVVGSFASDRLEIAKEKAV